MESDALQISARKWFASGVSRIDFTAMSRVRQPEDQGRI